MIPCIMLVRSQLSALKLWKAETLMNPILTDLFLKAFDKHIDIVDETSVLSDEFIDFAQAHLYNTSELFNQPIENFVEIVDSQVESINEYSLSMRNIIKVNNRFFKLLFEYVGDNLNEITDATLHEVHPKQKTVTVYG